MSMTVPAMTFPANCMPLCAMEDLPWETICQEWPGVPACLRHSVDLRRRAYPLTSPTSVDPFKHSSVSISGTMKSLTHHPHEVPGTVPQPLFSIFHILQEHPGCPHDFRRTSRRSFSRIRSPQRVRFSSISSRFFCMISSMTVLSTRFEHAFTNWSSIFVPVMRAAPLAISLTRS